MANIGTQTLNEKIGGPYATTPNLPPNPTSAASSSGAGGGGISIYAKGT